MIPSYLSIYKTKLKTWCHLSLWSSSVYFNTSCRRSSDYRSKSAIPVSSWRSGKETTIIIKVKARIFINCLKDKDACFCMPRFNWFYSFEVKLLMYCLVFRKFHLPSNCNHFQPNVLKLQ